MVALRFDILRKSGNGEHFLDQQERVPEAQLMLGVREDRSACGPNPGPFRVGKGGLDVELPLFSEVHEKLLQN